LTGSTLAMMNRGEIIFKGESEKWSITITECDNYLQVLVAGKRDHRDRVMWWKQSRRLFPEITDEDVDEYERHG
tara:strand:+ start:38 stop:259 length:222 start_codon:yes stop_codon:yes gene_type:complete